MEDFAVLVTSKLVFVVYSWVTFTALLYISTASIKLQKTGTTLCYCLAQAGQYCSLKFISMYHTFLWLCKCGDEKLANSTAVELLAGAYLPLSPVANNISPSTHRHATQHNKQCKRNVHAFKLAFKQARESQTITQQISQCIGTP